MPSTPLFIHNLEDGIAALEGAGREWVDRRSLEEALAIGKWTAWRIMKRCGAEEGAGGALVCRRETLIRRLREFQEGGWGPEIERRKRVERYLNQMARFSVQKRTE